MEQEEGGGKGKITDVHDAIRRVPTKYGPRGPTAIEAV